MRKKRIVYADNAATTCLLPIAYRAMLPFLRENFGNPSSAHSMGTKARIAVESAREKIAYFIQASPKEIFFTSGGTESNNLTLRGVTEFHKNCKKIITSTIEHHAILNTCLALEKNGINILRIPVDPSGLINMNAFERHITNDFSLVSVMLANNEIGTVQNIAKLVHIAHQENCLFHTDAVQALGHIQVDVQEMGIDMLSASAHKFGGPKGVGFLYRSEKTASSPLLTGGNQESGLRAGTENVAGIVGMAAALEWHIERLSTNAKKLMLLADSFRAKFSSAFPNAIFNGHAHSRLPGLVSVTLPSGSAERLVHILDLRGIRISAGAACSSNDAVPSHVLMAIGLTAHQAKRTLRISFGLNNTRADIDLIVDTIAQHNV